GHDTRVVWVAGSGMTGLGVSRDDPRHLRFGDTEGTLRESLDGGKTWTSRGGIAGHFVYRTAFDPANLDHVVVGTMSDGAFTSVDGALTVQAAPRLARP